MGYTLAAGLTVGWSVAVGSVTIVTEVRDWTGRGGMGGHRARQRNTGHSTLPTAERWNGTKWSVLTVPAPTGTTDAYLSAVACVSGTDCWGAGASMDSTLAEKWNGSKWSIVASPSPSAGKPNVLTGVACPSARECWAVGYTFPGSLSGSLIERWNGSKWAVSTS